ncbi:putative TIR domain-containing protein [Helianthus annuus]|nr:putative TIR domain-containing protein [Helianthus annuus]
MRAEIITFLDSDALQIGRQVDTGIRRVITESRASIIVFLENYAKSSWCLEELALILEQKRKGSHFVLPVYYGVDPSDVWNQRGNFKIEAKEGSGWTVDNVNRWKVALVEVANLMVSAVTGYMPEMSLIIRIVETIYSQQRLNPYNQRFESRTGPDRTAGPDRTGPDGRTGRADNRRVKRPGSGC